MADPADVEREETMQAYFVIWYYEHMQRGRGREAPLPSSAVAALYGVRREHWSHKVRMARMDSAGPATSSTAASTKKDIDALFTAK